MRLPALFTRLFLVLSLLWMVGCQGDPATPPAPPAELPAALKFPEDIGISVEKIRSEEEGMQRLVGPGGKYSNEISEGASIATMVNELLSNHLKIFNQMEIPVSTNTNYFEKRLITNMPVAFGGGEFTANVKIDFSDYDFDGDGKKEGCSGHTAATPICARLWINDQRFIAAVFDAYPIEDNPGSGRFRMSISTNKEELAGGDLLMAAEYDHTDSENKTSDLKGVGKVTGSGVDLAENFAGHVTISQLGSDETAMKTVSSTARIASETESLALFNYVAQWREDENYWNGSVVTEPSEGFLFKDFSNICAQISTGNEVEKSNCSDLGLDVSTVRQNSVPANDEVALPNDFPENPDF